MKVDFLLHVEPFSINKVHKIGRGKMYYNKSYLDWRRRVFVAMCTPAIKSKLKRLHEKFNDKKHGFRVELEFGIEVSKFWTKKKQVSLRSQDITNIEKPLIDLLFDIRFDGREVKEVDETLTNISIDDKFVVEMTSRKVPDVENSIHITIELVDLTESVFYDKK